MTTTLPNAPARTEAAQVVRRSPAGGWWRLYRHHLRLLRGGAIAWIAALTGVSLGVAATFEDRYDTADELAALAEMEGIPAFEALVGRYVEIATVEGLVLSRWGLFAVLVAVWAVVSTARLTRGAEEAGHIEPLRAGAVTPRGVLAATLAALLTVHLVFAAVIGASHSAVGMDTATSWALGAAIGLLAAAFAGVAALASQLVATRRRAVGIAGAVLGLALFVRVVAAAEATPAWLWWATPLGWIGYLHEVDQTQLTVVGLLTLLAGALVAAALAAARRDLHAGLVGGAEAPVLRSPGVRRAPGVRSQLGLAVRLTAAPVRTWGAAVAVFALAFGLLARDFSDAIADMPTTLAVVAELGWVGLDTPEGVVGWVFLLLALVLAVFAAGQAAAIREEEATWRIEHLLARRVGRVRWLATRVGVAAGAVAMLALVGGVAAWLGTVLVGSPIAFAGGVLAGVNVVPVAWLALGVGAAVLGSAPRLTAPMTYALVVAAFLLDFVGGYLDVPDAVLELSPFRYFAAVPAADLAAGPALVMVALAVAGVLLGLAVFSRRDLQEA